MGYCTEANIVTQYMSKEFPGITDVNTYVASHRHGNMTPFLVACETDERVAIAMLRTKLADPHVGTCREVRLHHPYIYSFNTLKKYTALDFALKGLHLSLYQLLIHEYGLRAYVRLLIHLECEVPSSLPIIRRISTIKHDTNALQSVLDIVFGSIDFVNIPSDEQSDLRKIAHYFCYSYRMYGGTCARALCYKILSLLPKGHDVFCARLEAWNFSNSILLTYLLCDIHAVEIHMSMSDLRALCASNRWDTLCTLSFKDIDTKLVHALVYEKDADIFEQDDKTSMNMIDVAILLREQGIRFQNVERIQTGAALLHICFKKGCIESTLFAEQSTALWKRWKGYQMRKVTLLKKCLPATIPDELAEKIVIDALELSHIFTTNYV